MRAWWLGIVVAVVALVPGRSQAGDRLGAARAQAGASSPSFGDDDDDDDDEGGIVLGLLSAFASDDEDHDAIQPGSVELDARRGFLPYPYASGRPGYMVRAEPGAEVDDDTRHGAVRFGAEGAYLYDDVWRTSAQLRLMLPRLYTQLRYDLMLEGPTPLLGGDLEVHGTVRDRLHFASLELGPQLNAGEHLAVRFGAIGTLMFDDRRSLPEKPTMSPGIGGVLEFDLYPVRPLVFSGRGAVLKLGQTVMFEARATVGVSLRRVEIYAGYDHRQIGGVHLGGPTAGVAVRF